MTYKIEDLSGIVDGPLTLAQEQGVLAYVNDGVIPPYDPCANCEPNVVRRLIAKVQQAEATGTWPPKRSRQNQELLDGVLPTISDRSHTANEEPIVAAKPGDVVKPRAPRKKKEA